MKEGPILFNAAMVRATLDGRKSQTRRVVKSPVKGRDITFLPDHYEADEYFQWEGGADKDNPHAWGVVNFIEYDPLTIADMSCPFGDIGDQLWVREKWQGFRQTSIEYDEWEEMESPKDRHDMFFEPVYAADNKNFPEKWQPSIHMPREFSRIDLEITGVRVERLQDISDADAVREGIMCCSTGLPEGVPPVYGFENDEGNFDEEMAAYTPRDAFAGLWKKINTRPGTTWDDNPWVWVIEFLRRKP